MLHKALSFGFLILFLFTCVAEAAIYRWTDDGGDTHITDRYADIPLQYRSQIRTFEFPKKPSIKRTVVKFRREGSSILLNATLNYSLPVTFIMDTGATNTMILEQDAHTLGFNLDDAPKTQSRIADGKVITLPLIRLSSIRVGEAEVQNLSVTVGKMRLLGLDFLKNFKVIVDAASEHIVLDAPEKVMMTESDSIRAEKKKAITEYEIKIQKAHLQIESIQKNMEILQIQINDNENEAFRYKEKLREAVDNNDSQNRIDKFESAIQQYELAVESRELNLQTYSKDIEILKNNIEYFEQAARKLQ